MDGSWIAPLRRPSDALVARLDVIGKASRSLDLQYYIWDPDPVGHLVLSRVLEAAGRGVVVRLLVDDMKQRRRPRAVATLGLHPNVEIRVFNPWSRSSNLGQTFELVGHWRQLNERMHNKMMLADSSVSIFGGRNIAAGHYGLENSFNLVDFDVLITGDQVSSVSSVFEKYWSSPTAVESVELSEVVKDDLGVARRKLADDLERSSSVLAEITAEEEGWSARLDTIRQPLAPNSLSVFADDPTVRGQKGAVEVGEALRNLCDRAESELVVVTPFFAPSTVDVDWYAELVRRGVDIKILTNSLASNEGTVSNSGLKKQRRHLLAAGVELYELRTDAAAKQAWEVPPQVARYLGLHAKFIAIDAKKMFVGSLNLDPRSKSINTEVGVLVEHQGVTGEIREAALALMSPQNAWCVEVRPDGRLTWTSDIASLTRQPARSVWQRLGDWVLGLLPIRGYV